MYGFGWLGRIWRFTVIHSKHYEDLAERLAESRRQNKALVDEYGAEITELQLTLDRSEQRGDYAQLKVSKLRREKIEWERTKSQLEGDNSELRLKIETLRNYAITGLEGVLKTIPQAPGFIVTPDFVPTKANEAAFAYFGGQFIGSNLSQLGISEGEQSQIREDMRRKGGPFILNYEGSRLEGWGIVPIRDEERRLLACLFTSEKELIRNATDKSHSLFRKALELLVGKTKLSENGVKVMDDLSLEVSR